MARYEIKSPDGQTWEITAPDDASEAEVMAYAQANWTPIDRAGGGRGVVNPPSVTPRAEERTWGQAAADTGAQLAEGVNSLIGAVPDLIAPNSGVSQFFRGNADYWRGQQSDALQQRTQAASQAIDAAGEDGVISQVVEAAKQYSSDPALAARFVVTNLPSVLPGIGAAKLAQAAALARGATAAKAAGVATTAAGGVNAVLNAGGARGDAYEDLNKTLQQKGYSAQEAEQMALDRSIVPAAVGGVAGFLSGKTGLEKALVGNATAGGAIRAGVRSAAVEQLGEQAEEVLPKVTTNLMAAPYDERTIGKDVGRTIVETAIGAGPGTIASGLAEGLSTSRENSAPPIPNAEDMARAKGFLIDQTIAPRVEDQPTVPVAPKVSPNTGLRDILKREGLTPNTEDPITPQNDAALLQGVPVGPTDPGAAPAAADPAAQARADSRLAALDAALSEQAAVSGASQPTANVPAAPVAQALTDPAATADMLVDTASGEMAKYADVQKAHIFTDPVLRIISTHPRAEPVLREMAVAEIARRAQPLQQGTPAAPLPLRREAALGDVQAAAPLATDSRTQLANELAILRQRAQEQAVQQEAQRVKAQAEEAARIASTGSNYQQRDATPVSAPGAVPAQAPQVGGASPAIEPWAANPSQAGRVSSEQPTTAGAPRPVVSQEVVNSLVEASRGTAAKYADISNPEVYPESALYGIINHPKVGQEMLGMARTELARRRGIQPNVNVNTSTSITGVPGSTGTRVDSPAGSGVQGAQPTDRAGGPTALPQANTAAPGIPTGAPTLGDQPAAGAGAQGAAPVFSNGQDGGAGLSTQPVALKEAPPAPALVATRVLMTLRNLPDKINARVSQRPLTEEQRLVSHFVAQTGKTLTWVESDDGRRIPDGWMNKTGGDHMFIDINGDKPLLETVLHEGTHALPDRIRLKLGRFILQRTAPEGQDAFISKYKYAKESPKVQAEEVLAYVSQQIARRPEFIQDLKTALGNKDFAEFARVLINKMREWLGRGDNQFDREFLGRYVSDVQGIHDELVKAYAEAMREQGLEPDAEITDMVFSQKPAQETVPQEQAAPEPMQQEEPTELETQAAPEPTTEREPTFAPKPTAKRKSRGIDPATRQENFRRWSNNAPLISSAEAEDHQFLTGQAVVLEAYHGTGRGDRVGTVFQPKRATSGPMAYFTSSPALASSYATGKADTSLAMEDNPFESWFKYKPKGQRSSVDIVRAWYQLTPEQKQTIAERMPDIRQDDDGNVIYEKGGGDPGSYQWELKQTQRAYDRTGNPLKAAVATWLESGNLYDQEQEFVRVLKLAGFPVGDLTYDNPGDTFPFVYRVYIKMQNPLVTNDIPESVTQALNAAAKTDRSRPKTYGADMWDKNTRTLRSWVEDFNKPDNKYVWTSIPDKVTEVFKSLGYDGIIDYSGKGGGAVAPVYIPFEETQVKSEWNRGTFDGEKKDILFSNKAQDLDQDVVLTFPVEGGKTAKMTVNAKTYLDQLSKREDALRMVKECLA